MAATLSAARWTPTSKMPELPLSAFNLTWRAEGRLICEGLYPPYLSAPHKGILISFEAEAFMSFDEYADYFEGTALRYPALSALVPYGGCWPFAEVLGSPWLAETTARDGVKSAADYRHWAVITQDQTLHVMALARQEPTFERWISW